MVSNGARILSFSFLLSSTAWAALAQSAIEVPLRNWTVPPYRASTSSPGGLTAMTDVTPGIGFVGVAPCRLVDTRQAGFPAGYGPPALTGGVPRNFDLNSDPLCPGIPSGVDAYSLNITVTNTQGPGFILIYPQGGAQPTVSTLNYLANETLANAAIVPAGVGGGVTVIAGVSGTNLIIDINGYFTDQYNAGVSFHAVSGSAAPAILAENTSTASEAAAIQGVITTTTPGPTGVAAVKGFNQGTNNTGVGVWGKHNGGGWGVLGESATGFGVVAFAGGTGPNAAVYAQNTSAGVASGVFGWANRSGVRNYGIQGWTDSIQSGAAGVFGQDGTGPTDVFFASAGVRGDSNRSTGVFGAIGPNGFEAVRGQIAGGPYGVLGWQGFSDYGVYSGGNAHVVGNLTVTGTISASMKPFIQPHPFDPSKQIRYVSLEGPHSEVYFRGTAQVSQGVTRIAIPEDFRLVASRDTYSTLVTPVGGMATVAVLSEGEDGIVIQASRNVKVHYVVYAEREAMKNPHPIVENVDFRPSPDAASGYPDSYRQLMIQNGTLNPDGTVNMETAKRLGWDKEWAGRERPAAQPSE